MSFTLRASDPDAPSRGGAVEINFGEGPPIISLLSPVPCDRYGTWSLPAPKPGAWVETYTHTYQQAGTYTVAFAQNSQTPGVPDCFDDRLEVGDPWASAARITMPVTVSSTPGSSGAGS